MTGSGVPPDRLERYWRATEGRDHRYDGHFWVAVVTTGIYCRPGCRAPAAKRANVRFYATAQAARAAGFRACKRCDPDRADGGTRLWSTPSRGSP